MAAINSPPDMSYQSVHESPLFRHLVATIQHSRNPDYVTDLLKQLFEEVDDSIIFDVVTTPCDISPTFHVIEPVAQSSTINSEGLIHLLSRSELENPCELLTILHNVDPSYPRKALSVKDNKGNSSLDSLCDYATITAFNRRPYPKTLANKNPFDPSKYGSLDVILSIIQNGSECDNRVTWMVAKAGGLFKLKDLFDNMTAIDLLDLLFSRLGDCMNHLRIAYPSEEYTDQSDYIEFLKYLHQRCTNSDDGKVMQKFQELLNDHNDLIYGEMSVFTMPFYDYRIKLAQTMIKIYPWFGVSGIETRKIITNHINATISMNNHRDDCQNSRCGYMDEPHNCPFTKLMDMRKGLESLDLSLTKAAK
jgi:hypothetical protein